MARRNTSLVEGEYYHIYNRGNSKQLIFVDDEDRDRFVKLLYLSNSHNRFNFREDVTKKNIEAFDLDRGNPIVAISAWVLMPNHFHLYLTIPESKDEENKSLAFGENKNDVLSNISLFMEKLCMSYSKYFNAKHKRTGSLFEGKFKSTHINNDNQAKYLFSYIHLNPVKLIQKDWKEKGIRDVKKVLSYLDGYAWSSYADFKGEKRVQGKILNIEKFPEYFLNVDDFDKEILDWITIKATE